VSLTPEALYLQLGSLAAWSLKCPTSLTDRSPDPDFYRKSLKPAAERWAQADIEDAGRTRSPHWRRQALHCDCGAEDASKWIEPGLEV